MILPISNAEEAAVVDGIDVYPVRSLRQAADIIERSNGDVPFKQEFVGLKGYDSRNEDDFADVKGQERAKRALEATMSGGHNLLMEDPRTPGRMLWSFPVKPLNLLFCSDRQPRQSNRIERK